MVRIILLIGFLIISSNPVQTQDKEAYIPPQVRFLRIFGGTSEANPPILLLSDKGTRYNIPIAHNSLTIEIDFDSPQSPNLYATFIHCNFDWAEDENIFLSDITMNRTSLISWATAPIQSDYYTYRGTLIVPNPQVRFSFSGNWKVKLWDYNDDSKPVAEGKFFVVQPRGICTVDVYNDFYLPDLKVAPVCFNVQASIMTQEQLFDSRINNAVIYRNHRWNEPYIISEDRYTDLKASLYKYQFNRMTGGIASINKSFRIEKIPAENTYRVLDLANTTLFTSTSQPQRLPMSDLRRTGSYLDYDDDGAMITYFVPDAYDDYLNLEFLLDPDGWVSTEEVYVVGSFNQWKPDLSWQMYFDSDYKLYRVRNVVRRARHNYMYVTGRYNNVTGQVEKVSYEEFEGNNSSTNHTFFAFIYYKDFEYGGYDAIMAVGAGNLFGTITK
jgi:hypothetical protein